MTMTMNSTYSMEFNSYQSQIIKIKIDRKIKEIEKSIFFLKRKIDFNDVYSFYFPTINNFVKTKTENTVGSQCNFAKYFYVKDKKVKKYEANVETNFFSTKAKSLYKIHHFFNVESDMEIKIGNNLEIISSGQCKIYFTLVRDEKEGDKLLSFDKNKNFEYIEMNLYC